MLTPRAKERLANIALVKPDKAENLETALISTAKGGGFSGKVSEERLVEMLEMMSEAAVKADTVTIKRKFDLDEELEIDESGF